MQIQTLPGKLNYKSIRTAIIIGFITTCYLILVQLFIGLKTEHYLMAILYNLLFIYGGKARKFILGFTAFVLFGVIYDMMKIYPNYLVNKIDIAQIYCLEKKLFGININGNRLTLNEFFSKNNNQYLDILSGFFYLNWMSVPLLFAFYMYLKNKRQFLLFSLTFLLTNLLGFCIYYIHPAAPPWYVQQYGFELHYNIPGNAAGFIRFDKCLNIKIFESIYSKNSNVFAALPSLHASYPLVVLYYALKNKLKNICIFLTIFVLGTWFSAVYMGHHYVLDIIAGILCAFSGIFSIKLLYSKSIIIRIFLRKYETQI
ncbi:MAG: phosphatase PAP2 family protein [Bacteroidota bacterium]|nr:phosphatase PAP2 family protein [Bacteroidota bacterium]